MDEKKTCELGDEALDAVAGGGTFVVPNLKKWCSQCNTMVSFRVVYEDRITVYKCLECGSPIE